MNKNNYYDQIIFDIKDFINKKEYDKASKIIEDELNMPYIPLDFEDKLFNIKKNLSLKFNDDRNKKYNSISIAWYFDFLRNEKIDFFEKFEIIKNFDSFNLRNNFLILKKIFFDTKINDLLKLKLLLIIKRQEIKKDIDILFSDGKKENFNLEKIEDFYLNKNFLEDLNLIEIFLFKDPVIKNFSFLILEIFYIFELRKKNIWNKEKNLFYLKSMYISAIFFQNQNLQNLIKKEILDYESFILEIRNFFINFNLKK